MFAADIVSMEYYYKLTHTLLKGVISNELE